MSDIDTLLHSAVLLLLVTTAAVGLSKYLGLGSVLGLLSAGVIVGPYTPGIYLTTHVDEVRNFAELGTILLLFLIGLEIQPKRLWAMRRDLFGLGLLQLLISGLVIACYLLLFHFSWSISLLGGFTLALSSTALVMQILYERGEITSRHGRAAFAVLLMQDLAVVPLLALVPIVATHNAIDSYASCWESIKIILGTGLLLWIFGSYFVPWALYRLVRQGNNEGFTLLVLLAVLLAAWAMHQTGLSTAFGAFAMGMLLSGSKHSYQIEARIEPHKGLLMSLFFVAVGMSINPAPILANPLWFSYNIIIITFIKFVVLFGLGIIFGLKIIGSLRFSILLTQSGEFGFVLFGSALKLELIDNTTFALGVGVISVSMLMTPLLIRLGDRLARYLDEHRSKLQQPLPISKQQIVIIGGYGRVGHTIAVILHSSGVPFIAFDKDLARVTKGQEEGFAVYCGDIIEAALWEAAHVEQAALVALTIEDDATAIRVTSYLRSVFPELQIVSRARDLQSCGQLLQAGASYAFPEVVESSMRLSAQILEMMGKPTEDISLLLTGVRRTNYSLVNEHSQ